MTADYDQEKQGTTYNEKAHDFPTDASLNLEKERTFEGIDLQNRYAVKGDDSDGKVVWSTRIIFAAIFLAGLYTGSYTLQLEDNHIPNHYIGSQAILYFTGGSLSFIEEDLKLSRGSAWLPTANILAIAATCPYAGYLQDLFGKRYIAL